MSDFRIGSVESQFADIIWENEPLKTKQLVELCAEKFEWKRTTTYTVLKRLCERGIFKVDKSIITSLMTKEEFYTIQSEKIIDEAFKGSLPAFIAAFSSRKTLSKEEVQEIQEMINKYKEGNRDE